MSRSNRLSFYGDETDDVIGARHEEAIQEAISLTASRCRAIPSPKSRDGCRVILSRARLPRLSSSSISCSGIVETQGGDECVESLLHDWDHARHARQRQFFRVVISAA